MSEIFLKCNCGNVRGVASNVSPTTGNRIVCYCGDCREFVTHLSGDNRFLDKFGGTDNYQMAPANFKITEGIEHVRCLRLTDKGMFRWYADCCKTPIGNTPGVNIPFISLFTDFIEDKALIEKSIGPVRGYLKIKSATLPVPVDRSTSSAFKAIARAVYKIGIWKITGLDKPNVFFDSSGKPISKPIILRSPARIDA